MEKVISPCTCEEAMQFILESNLDSELSNFDRDDSDDGQNN